MDYGDGDYQNGRLLRHAAVWLQARVRERGLGLRPKLNAGPVFESAYAACSAVSKRLPFLLPFIFFNPQFFRPFPRSLHVQVHVSVVCSY